MCVRPSRTLTAWPFMAPLRCRICFSRFEARSRDQFALLALHQEFNFRLLMNQQRRPLHALAGHLLDLYRLLAFNPLNPHSYSKYRNLRAVQRRTGASMLIETGTFLGVTTNRCAPHFERIYTVEIEPKLAAQAKTFLGQHPHVEVVLGDADVEVRRLFEEKKIHNTLIFLDGHFSAGLTGSADNPEPAVSILEFLLQHAGQIAGIVIDDYREFGTQTGWPTKWQLTKTAEELFSPKGFRLTVHLDQMLLERLRPTGA